MASNPFKPDNFGFLLYPLMILLAIISIAAIILPFVSLYLLYVGAAYQTQVIVLLWTILCWAIIGAQSD